MLLSYSAKNFYSFKEGIEVSFRLPNSYLKSTSNTKKVTNALCIKGANGAGKSNALKVLDFLTKFCCNSFSLKPEDPLNFKSFFDNETPTDFKVEFEINGIEYVYDLSITKKEVLNESIIRKIKRGSVLFERIKNKITKTTEEFNELKEIKLRSNASIISTAHQYEIKKIDFAYSFFFNFITSINTSLSLLGETENESFNKRYSESENFFSFTKEILKKFDLGIKDIIIKERKIDENETKYIPYFIHENNGKDYNLLFEQESSGTQNLYYQLYIYKVALELGCVFALDEFDNDLHPDILPLLVDLFTREETNPNNAQFIFTTHSSSILDQMGKYRTILVNKEENESYLYRLDELPGDMIRNDRPLEPVYRSGKIGGVPKV